jgi:peptide/nickel transport system ATP-binding protein
MQELLGVNNLIVHYEMDDGVVEAVNNVSFSINKGETFGIIGETGAGKTTIALSVLGLLPPPRSNVISGSIFLGDDDLLQKSRKEMMHILGKRISMIFQDPMTALNPVHKIGEQIAEVIALHYPELSKHETMLAALKMLQEVGIQGDRYNDYPFQFSGGMKQRVVIAMALACRPDLIIADEPTTALDVTIQAQVLELMKNLKDKYNTAILLITHDFGVVAEICDKCAVMYAGEFVECGTLEDIFRRPKHPYTIGLFNSLPKLGDDAERLKPIQGLMPDPMELPQHCTFAERCDRATEQCRQSDPPITRLSGEHMVKCFCAGDG